MLDVVALKPSQERLDQLLAAVVRHHVLGAVVILKEVRRLIVDAERDVEGVATELVATALYRFGFLLATLRPRIR